MQTIKARACAEARRIRASLPESGSRLRGAAAVFTIAALGFGGCAQQPQRLAAGHSKEYFPSSVYGRASRRVVENGPIPHGGGQYLVGKPYTIAGQTYYPSEKRLVQVGTASWYGDAFHGRLTANGEIYDRDSFTAAHPTMPLPSYARVTNLRNHASMIVRVNDRGPYASNRIMDVSRRVAEALDFKRTGTGRVKVEYVGRASLAGSDDAKLYATLRTNGPAQWHSGDENLMTAQAEPRVPYRTASVEPMAAPEPPPPPPPPVIERRPEPIVRSEPDIRPEPVARPEPVVHAEPVMRSHPAPMPRAEMEDPLPRPVPHPHVTASREPAFERSIPEHRPAPEPTPPMRTAAIAPHQPVLHWQHGPEGKPVSNLSWSEPKPFNVPKSLAHAQLRQSHQDFGSPSHSPHGHPRDDD